MSVLLSIPVLGLISILQSAVVSRLPLNRGTADLMLVLLVAIALQQGVTTTCSGPLWAVYLWTLYPGCHLAFLP